ncbi:alpha-2-macroglobulin-like protein 1 [Oncorhynchus mykiss]|uniref:alpha-2-macroglobulin-like protein 1 n=1 Tax=Oncorhynchus mykiss TaxID=8022 RepID=UPI0018779E46|nr:alpha-2-macroglobulin-like protein 1 [Oncorhynchus mykiss]
MQILFSVFTLLSLNFKVFVTPAHSLDYTLTPLKDVQYSSCLCAKGRKTFSWTMAPSILGVTMTEVELQLPKNVVDGSDRISLSVLGDILGRALKNLDGLLQMPYGCGEQNMALLAPNIYILEYLRNTDQLTPAIRDKAIKFLTSFCFPLKKLGGVTDEVTLTAYITASMLDLNISVSDPVVYRSLSCLRNSTSDLSNTYTTALLAYTFTLAGDMETRTQLLQHLDTISLQEASLAVEINSYLSASLCLPLTWATPPASSRG